MKLYILGFLFMLATPAFAQESILLNVNQTHTLQWDWAQGEDGPIRTFVFQCQQYRNELEADARSLRFGNLIDQPGRYTGCTLSAKNEAGLSAPVVVPDFEYAYSYQRLVLWIFEIFGATMASTTAITLASYNLVSMWRRRRATKLALPEPCIILEKERDHADRYH